MSENTIVVVEDDPLLRSDTVAMLDGAGLNVADFETADEALVYLEERNGKVAGVLTDIQMPGKARRFRSRHKDRDELAGGHSADDVGARSAA